MLELNKIYNEDCLEGMKSLPDNSVDLIVTDPPYAFKDIYGAGTFGTRRAENPKNGRKYQKELAEMKDGITDEYLEEMCRVCKLPHIYLFCSKDQVPQYLNFALSHKLNFDILTWHKTNPTPMCGNKYLSDTEYIILMRAPGARIYGTFETKRKYFISKKNDKDKRLYGHPTCKPVSIVKTLIFNSSQEGDLILDPFMGSGTTAIACIREKRNFIGFELNKEYFDKANERIRRELAEPSLF